MKTEFQKFLSYLDALGGECVMCLLEDFDPGIQTIEELNNAIEYRWPGIMERDK